MSTSEDIVKIAAGLPQPPSDDVLAWSLASNLIDRLWPDGVPPDDLSALQGRGELECGKLGGLIYDMFCSQLEDAQKDSRFEAARGGNASR
jgi:hypothetical protein